jgi:hypothetical protein
MIFLVELIVGKTLEIQTEEERLLFESGDAPVLNDRDEKIDSVTDGDKVGIFSSKKCYPRYLVTF